MDIIKFVTQIAVKKAIAPILWDYIDNFTDTVAAGSVDGTAATPGAATREVVDSNNKLSIGNNLLKIATGGSTWGNPGIWWDAFTRSLGKQVAFATEGFSAATLSGNGFINGISAAQTGVGGEACFIVTSAAPQARENSANIPLPIIRQDTVYHWVISLRAAGAFYFIRGGAYPHPTLIRVGKTGATATVYPVISGQVNPAFNSSRMGVLTDLWIPTPLVSDGFGSTFGTTDGLGHTENAGLGAGGGSKTWVQDVGSWANAAGVATGTTGGGIAVATTDAGTPYFVASVTPSRAAGNIGIEFWRTDESNCCRAYHDGTKFVLSTIVAGTETKLVNITTGIGEIRVFCLGSYVIAWCNDAIGWVAPQTDAQSVITTVTPTNFVGLYSTDNGNTFNDFNVYASGYNDEYSNLERYFQTKTLVNFMPVGDSKSAFVSGYQTRMETTAINYHVAPYKIAYSGYTTAQIKAIIDAQLALKTGTPAHVLVNLTVNDFAGIRATTLGEVAWSADMAYIASAINTKYPSAKIWFMLPWKQGYDTEADTYAGWLGTFIASRSNYCFTGADERVFLKGADDGATMTSDGVHPTEAGHSATAAAWRAVIEA